MKIAFYRMHVKNKIENETKTKGDNSKLITAQLQNESRL